jgi:1-acyl-sn-glycerol-3-phosphate acyltransferase
VDLAETLLDQVREVARELHPHRPAVRALSLDSTIDGDLGLDSLSRMELLARIERRLELSIPERVFAEAETPRDLLRAIDRAVPREPVPPSVDPEPTGIQSAEDVRVPCDARTLTEALAAHASRNPQRIAIHLYDELDRIRTLTYGELSTEATLMAAELLRCGLQPGESVAIMLPTCREYFVTLYGVLLAGGISVPIYPPWRLTRLEEYVRHQQRILDNCRAAMLVSFDAADRVARLLQSRVDTLRSVVRAVPRAMAAEPEELPRPSASDVALLQYTSGSTGSPKGVVLTHANILANLRAMGDAIAAGPDDLLVSWLPLYHDMGLIGACFGTMYFGMPLAVMSPLSFLARPLRWLQAIRRHRATISGAPNFAYELCLRRISDEDLQGLDLSSWRVAVNAAEPVSPDTIERFCERFGRCAFRRETMAPVFGLAEASVGLTFPPLGRAPVVDRIDRESFARSGLAVPVGESHDNALRFVACGKPVPGHEVRIVNPAGKDLPERREGHLLFRGPSATSGYFRNVEATRRLFRGDWLDSGDLAYVAEGDVYISARSKDIIIRAGRNVYPAELEEAVGNLDGVRKGCVAVFGNPDPELGTERLVVMAETREEEPQVREALTAAVNETVAHLVQAPPDDVVFVSPRTIAKTSSGKIRRAASRELYLQGIDRPRPSLRWQVARLMLASIGPRLRRMLRALAHRLYGAYVWSLALAAALVVAPLVYVLPDVRRRRSVVRWAIRLLSYMMGTPISVEGDENLRRLAGGCVYVSNHASYIDGCVLLLALPRDFSFVAKAELAGNPVLRSLLTRMGTVFVERIDRQRGVEDSRFITDSARTGQPFLFFPEGTFRQMPGVLPFRTGAFVTAAEADVPVVPLAIRGTRSLLRAYSWLPRPHAIRVTVGEVIEPSAVRDEAEDDTWAIALGLRDLARKEILRYCGEPDLGSHPMSNSVAH